MAASKIWLCYLELDLFDELEIIHERLTQLAAQFSDSGKFNAAAGRGNNGKDRSRDTWISKFELGTVSSYRQILENATYQLWKKNRVYEDGMTEFFAICELQESVNSRTIVDEDQRPRHQSKLEKQLVVCFGPADAVVTEQLAKGLPSGMRGIDGDHTYQDKVRQEREQSGLQSCRFDYQFRTARYEWEYYGWLPSFWYGSQKTDWWRPYRREGNEKKKNEWPYG